MPQFVQYPNQLVVAPTLGCGPGCGSGVDLVARTARNSRSLSLDQSVRQPLPPPSPPSTPPFSFPSLSPFNFLEPYNNSPKRLCKETKTHQWSFRSLIQVGPRSRPSSVFQTVEAAAEVYLTSRAIPCNNRGVFNRVAVPCNTTQQHIWQRCI